KLKSTILKSTSIQGQEIPPGMIPKQLPSSWQLVQKSTTEDDWRSKARLTKRSQPFKKLKSTILKSTSIQGQEIPPGMIPKQLPSSWQLVQKSTTEEHWRSKTIFTNTTHFRNKLKSTILKSTSIQGQEIPRGIIPKQLPSSWQLVQESTREYAWRS